MRGSVCSSGAPSSIYEGPDIRVNPIGETLAEAARAEQQLQNVERDRSANELLVYALRKPELVGWDLDKAREWVEEYGFDAARSTLDAKLGEYKRALEARRWY